jgi:hypothetical protein
MNARVLSPLPLRERVRVRGKRSKSIGVTSPTDSTRFTLSPAQGAPGTFRNGTIFYLGKQK